MRKPQPGDIYVGNKKHKHFKNIHWLRINEDKTVTYLYHNHWFHRLQQSPPLHEALNDPKKYKRLE